MKPQLKTVATASIAIGGNSGRIITFTRTRYPTNNSHMKTELEKTFLGEAISDFVCKLVVDMIFSFYE
jgi:hypothetical protein